MAVTFIATGITATADVTTPFANQSYTLPTGHVAGDLLIAFYGGKPYDTVPSTPSGYTAHGGGANGTTAMGSGTGSVYAVAFTKVDGGSESNPASTFSAQYSPAVRAMLAIRSSPGTTWTVTSCKGSDSAATSTTYSAQGDATLGYTTDDIVVVSLVHNDDSSSDSSFGISIPGCTVGTVTQQLTGTLTTSTGNDARMYVLTAKIESGTASGAPTVTATTGSGDSDGQSVFLRVQGANWGHGPNLATTNIATGTDTLAATTGFVDYAGSTLSSSTTRSVSGSRSLQVDSTGVRFSIGTHSSYLAPAVAGKVYAAGADLYPATNASSAYTFVVYIGFYDAAKAMVGGDYMLAAVAALTPDQWNSLGGGGVTAPAGTVWAEVLIYRAVAAGGTTESLWIDNVFVWEGTSDTWEAPPNASGSLSLSGTATASGSSTPATASGSLTLSGSASARTPATAAGSLTLGGSATTKASATATGTLSLSGSITGQATAGTAGTLSLTGTAIAGALLSGDLYGDPYGDPYGSPGATGSLTFDGSATAGSGAGEATAGGTLTFGGSVNAQAPVTATGSLSLTGSAAAQAPVSASGSLTLAGSTAAVARPAASGSLTFGGTVAATTQATATGGITLGGTAGWVAPPVAGSLTLTGSTTAQAPVTASGSLAFSGTADAVESTSIAGLLSLTGMATAHAAAAASGSLTLGGTTTWSAPAIAGTLSLTGSATAQAPTTASGSLTLAGDATATVAGTIAGSLSLSSTATWTTTATGSLTLGGTGNSQTPAVTLGTISLSGLVTAAAQAAVTGLLELAGDVEIATPPGTMQPASAAVATLTTVRVLTPTVLSVDAAAPALAPASTATATMTGTTTTTATIERS